MSLKDNVVSCRNEVKNLYDVQVKNEINTLTDFTLKKFNERLLDLTNEIVSDFSNKLSKILDSYNGALDFQFEHLANEVAQTDQVFTMFRQLVNGSSEPAVPPVQAQPANHTKETVKPVSTGLPEDPAENSYDSVQPYIKEVKYNDLDDEQDDEIPEQKTADPLSDDDLAGSEENSDESKGSVLKSASDPESDLESETGSSSHEDNPNGTDTSSLPPPPMDANFASGDKDNVKDSETETGSQEENPDGENTHDSANDDATASHEQKQEQTSESQEQSSSESQQDEIFDKDELSSETDNLKKDIDSVEKK